jgi:ATP-dependent DNA helicase PIF1
MQSLNSDQKAALELLQGRENIFLTGAAGSGKSFLLREYLKGKDIPILASTGAAAILVGGRTFHSFFGLGIMEGGVDATVLRASKNKQLMKRIKKYSEIVIDEVSMLSGPTLRAAEMIARKTFNSIAPWGGLRVIVVGDFSQLPPVNPFSRQKEWAFQDPVWEESRFVPVILKKIMRSTDMEFLEVLRRIRHGILDDSVIEFLDSRVQVKPTGDFTRLFPHRADVDTYNLQQLQQIDHEVHVFPTQYSGKATDIERFRKHSPIGEELHLKKDALVMIRQNDPVGRFVNGSLGRIQKISDESLKIKLDGGRTIELEKAEFTLLDADGKIVVSAINFPITLAWAMTIHKAQGATLDQMHVDLRKIWEPGQAYVALSRVRRPEGLFIEGWSKNAIFCDRDVFAFHKSLVRDV